MKAKNIFFGLFGSLALLPLVFTDKAPAPAAETLKLRPAQHPPGDTCDDNDANLRCCFIGS